METYSIILLSILFSAFFSGMEIAYVSQNRMQIEIERKKHNLVSRLYIFLCERPKKFITTMLLGNTLALVVYSYAFGGIITNFLTDKLHLEEGFGTLLIQTLISTFIIIITAEFLPKAIFSLNPFRLFTTFTIPAFIIYIILSPFTWIVNQITSLFFLIFNMKDTEDEPEYLKEELSYFISEKLEDIEDEQIDTEIQIFQNALNFSELKARDCLVPRKEIVAVEINSPIEEVRDKFVETGYSKLIVYKENIDNIIGYVHSFDLFKKPEALRSILLPIENVYESSSAKEIMDKLISKRRSIAIVLDEYGGTSGMLTLEDIVEELFGDIEDEHDTPTYLEEKISNTEYELATRLEIDYLNEKYGLYLPESDQYETLGGMIIYYNGDIPKQAQEIKIKNYDFLILKVSDTKIEEVRMTIHED